MYASSAPELTHTGYGCFAFELFRPESSMGRQVDQDYEMCFSGHPFPVRREFYSYNQPFPSQFFGESASSVAIVSPRLDGAWQRYPCLNWFD
jgi:hypothetical protein